MDAILPISKDKLVIMTWFINIVMVKTNHYKSEEFEWKPIFRKVGGTGQVDQKEQFIKIEVVEIYLCTTCKPWHVLDIVHK